MSPQRIRGGYFGMRAIAVKTIDGVPRILLNGSFLFQNGRLDQGFWPDGSYTAATDDALKSDIQQEKSWGSNLRNGSVGQKWSQPGGAVRSVIASCASGADPPKAAATSW